MNCQELIDVLDSYIDGTMPAEFRTNFERHLHLCPPCIEYLNSYRDTIRIAKKVCKECPESVEAKIPPELIAAILKSCKDCK